MSGVAGKLLFDFDRIDEWSPRLDEVLIPLLPNDFTDRLHKAKPEYVEDACAHVLESSDRTAIINAVLAWLASTDVAAYQARE